VIDEHSYWIDACSEETKLANIHVGDPVQAMLLGFQSPISGNIESITRVATALRTRQAARRGLSNVDRSSLGFGLRNELQCVSGSNKSVRRYRSLQE
jgi:hypothetical protein